MNIKLKGYKVDDHIAYKFLHYNPCCNELKNNPCIVFSEELYDEDNDTVDPYAMAVVEHRVVYSYGDSLDFDDYYKINFCPHCGEKIQISIVEIEDVTEIYNSIKKEQNKLCKRANKCDSKSQEKELRKQISILSDKLNWYLNSGDCDKDNETGD